VRETGERLIKKAEDQQEGLSPKTQNKMEEKKRGMEGARKRMKKKGVLNKNPPHLAFLQVSKKNGRVMKINAEGCGGGQRGEESKRPYFSGNPATSNVLKH